MLPWIAAGCLCSCVAEAPQRETQGPREEPLSRVVELAQPALLDRFATAAPGVNREALRLALQARSCALRSGLVDGQATLALIDYTRPSTQPRLWVFGLDRLPGGEPRVLFFDYVAHGRGSGENFARHFSNAEGSLQSSLGLFRTAETYVGENGYSLRLDGLEPGVNDNARSRALVMHGAWYVDPLLGAKQGRIGRSLGCPALRPAVAHAVIDTLKQGQLLFAYSDDPRWLATSTFLHCDGKPSGG